MVCWLVPSRMSLVDVDAVAVHVRIAPCKAVSSVKKTLLLCARHLLQQPTSPFAAVFCVLTTSQKGALAPATSGRSPFLR